MSEFCSLCHVVEEGPYCAAHGVVHRPFPVGDYDLDRLVGMGSASFVFGGRERARGRTVVVKLPRAQSHGDRDWHLREAAAVRQRELQVGVELLEVGWDDGLGVTFVVMEQRAAQADTAVQRLLLLDAPLDAAVTDPGAPPVMIGSYRVTEVLGAGGTGRVFLGEHPLIGSKVAIKVLRPEIARSPETVERFVQEARASSRIGSPHIPRYFDFGTTTDGLPYAIMEYFDGETLGHRLRREHTMSIADTAAVLEQIASALAMAHQAGLVHRDLKPDNILLVKPDARHSAPHVVRSASGEALNVKVLDFGIAKMVNAPSASRTEAGSFVGTPFYCAPEQVFGRGVDARTDVYSLGATAYEMLSGAPPFTGEVHEILSAKSMGDAPDLREAGVPDVVAETIGKMLARDPEQRAPSMEWVAAQVTRWAEAGELQRAVTARSWSDHQPVSTGEAVRSPWRRRIAMLAGAAVLAGGAAVGLSWRRAPAPVAPAAIAPAPPTASAPVAAPIAPVAAPIEPPPAAPLEPPAVTIEHAAPPIEPAGSAPVEGKPSAAHVTRPPGRRPARPERKPPDKPPGDKPPPRPDPNGVLIVDPFAPSP